MGGDETEPQSTREQTDRCHTKYIEVSELFGASTDRWWLNRAEQLVRLAPNLDELIKTRQSSLKRKLRSKFNDKRSRSLLSLNSIKDESVFGMFVFRFTDQKEEFGYFFRQGPLLET